MSDVDFVDSRLHGATPSGQKYELTDVFRFDDHPSTTRLQVDAIFSVQRGPNGSLRFTDGTGTKHFDLPRDQIATAVGQLVQMALDAQREE